MHPLVSIILPIFNAADFLEESIASVKSQSFTQWELLLIDDGSTDASGLIAQRHADGNPDSIFLLRHDQGANCGLPASRNLGLEHARGEFVALLDADDVWLPHKLESQLALFRAHPEAAMVFGRSEYWHDWTPRSAQPNTCPAVAYAATVYAPPDLACLTYPLGAAGSPCPSDVMFRRAAALRIGGFVEEFAGPWEDIAFLTKMFLNFPVFVSNECWDRYRIHPMSMSAQARASGDESRARKFYFEWLHAYMRNNGITDQTLWRRYRAQTWQYRHPTLAALYRALRARARPLKALAMRR